MKDKLFLALLETSAAHAEASRREFQKLDLSEGQPKVLYILHAQDGHMQKDLAQICGVRQSTLTVLLRKLEQEGYICKKSSMVSGGKRANRIYLTERGREKADLLVEVVEKLEEQGFAGFSMEERTALLSMLGRVAQNMKDS